MPKYIISPTYKIPSFDAFCHVLHRMKLKKHFSKFSKKTYDNYILIYFLFLKTKTNMSYRRICELIKELLLHRNLGIKRVPHFTTLQKLFSKLPSDIIRKCIQFISKSYLRNKPKIVAIDGTGISTKKVSQHYLFRIKYQKYKISSKLSIISDVKSNLILDAISHSKNVHDNLDFLPLCEVLKKYKIKRLCADRGYDSEDNFRFLFKNNIDPQIPTRVFTKTKKSRGKFRNKSKKTFSEEKYHIRSNVESTFSALKRTLTGDLNDRKSENIIKSNLMKVFVYNSERIKRLKQIKKRILYLLLFFHEKVFY